MPTVVDRSSSLRRTQQRAAIRNALIDAGRPLSPVELLDDARRMAPSLSIATVYRNLKTLVEEGEVVPVDLPGESSRFEMAGKAHHHHFHCRRCGKAYELEGCVADFKATVPKGFRVEAHEVVLYGTCAACAAAR